MALANPEPPTAFDLRATALSVVRSHGRDCLRRYRRGFAFGVRPPVAVQPERDRVVPALTNGIANVIRIRAEEQVVGVAARGVVACVADAHAIGDWAVDGLPHNAMRATVMTIEPNLAVALGRSLARPDPALSAWVNG